MRLPSHTSEEPPSAYFRLHELFFRHADFEVISAAGTSSLTTSLGGTLQLELTAKLSPSSDKVRPIMCLLLLSGAPRISKEGTCR